MPFNLLLLPLIGGYFFISRFYITAFYAARHTRERLILTSALAGIFLLIAARLTTLLIASHFPNLVGIWKTLAPFEYGGTAFGALALGLALPPVFNHIYPREKAYRRVVRKADTNALERLFIDAQDRSQPIILTLESGKVYVGLIQWTPPNPGATEEYIRILPILSGYRKDETHEIEFTTTYAPVIDQTVLNAKTVHTGPRIEDIHQTQSTSLHLNDFVRVLPLSQIAMAGKFDHDAYRLFNEIEIASKAKT